MFQGGLTTLYRWFNSADLQPKPARERQRQLDKVALAEHVRNFPDALLRERAVHFSVHINAIWTALKKLKIIIVRSFEVGSLEPAENVNRPLKKELEHDRT